MALPDAEPHLQHRRPDHQGGVLARPAQHRAQGRGVSRSRPASATSPTSAPSPSSSSSTRSATSRTSTPASTTIDSAEGQWNTGRKTDPVNDRSGKLVEGPNLGYKPRYKEGYFPVAPDRHPAGHPRRDGARDGEGRHPRREAPPRGRDRRPGRDRHALPAARRRWATRSCGTSTSSRTSRAGTARRRRSCRSRSSATTARGMHTHQSIWKGEKPLFAGDGYGGMSELAMHYIGGILKHAPALAAFTNPTHELLPPPGAGLRGAGEPRVLQPQPLGRGAHPDVLAVAEGEAHRGPLPRSDVQRLHRLRGDADGGPRRHRAPARRRASRSTRTSTRSRPRS